jgi:hypothetical protein
MAMKKKDIEIVEEKDSEEVRPKMGEDRMKELLAEGAKVRAEVEKDIAEMRRIPENSLSQEQKESLKFVLENLRRLQRTSRDVEFRRSFKEHESILSKLL